jgi:hypothetical protein
VSEYRLDFGVGGADSAIRPGSDAFEVERRKGDAEALRKIGFDGLEKFLLCGFIGVAEYVIPPGKDHLKVKIFRVVFYGDDPLKKRTGVVALLVPQHLVGEAVAVNEHYEVVGAVESLQVGAELAGGDGCWEGFPGKITDEEVYVVGRISLGVDPEVKEGVVFYAARAFRNWSASSTRNGSHPGSAFKSPEGERAGETVARESSIAEHFSDAGKESRLTALLGASTKHHAGRALVQKARTLADGEFLAGVETTGLWPGIIWR